MTEDLQKLEELEPGGDLDHRVRRRMRATMALQRRPAPLLPFEGAIYAVVLAAYVVYAGARAVQLFQEGRAPHVLHAGAPFRPMHEVRDESSAPCKFPGAVHDVIGT